MTLNKIDASLILIDPKGRCSPVKLNYFQNFTQITSDGYLAHVIIAWNNF